MITAPLFCCVAAFVFALVRTWSRRRRLLAGLMVPPAASWVWGHEKDIFEAETGTKYTAWADELGPTYKLKSPWLVGAVHATLGDPQNLRVTPAPGLFGYSRPRGDQSYLLKEYVQLPPFACVSPSD